MTKTENRGGARENAGRKPLDPSKKKKAVTCRFAPDILRFLAKLLPGKKTETIEKAIRQLPEFKDQD